MSSLQAVTPPTSNVVNQLPSGSGEAPDGQAPLSLSPEVKEALAALNSFSGSVKEESLLQPPFANPPQSRARREAVRCINPGPDDGGVRNPERVWYIPAEAYSLEPIETMSFQTSIGTVTTTVTPVRFKDVNCSATVEFILNGDQNDKYYVPISASQLNDTSKVVDCMEGGQGRKLTSFVNDISSYGSVPVNASGPCEAPETVAFSCRHDWAFFVRDEGRDSLNINVIPLGAYNQALAGYQSETVVTDGRGNYVRWNYLSDAIRELYPNARCEQFLVNRPNSEFLRLKDLERAFAQAHQTHPAPETCPFPRTPLLHGSVARLDAVLDQFDGEHPVQLPRNTLVKNGTEYAFWHDIVDQFPDGLDFYHANGCADSAYTWRQNTSDVLEAAFRAAPKAHPIGANDCKAGILTLTASETVLEVDQVVEWMDQVAPVFADAGVKMANDQIIRIDGADYTWGEIKAYLPTDKLCNGSSLDASSTVAFKGLDAMDFHDAARAATASPPSEATTFSPSTPPSTEPSTPPSIEPSNSTEPLPSNSPAPEPESDSLSLGGWVGVSAGAFTGSLLASGVIFCAIDGVQACLKRRKVGWWNLPGKAIQGIYSKFNSSQKYTVSQAESQNGASSPPLGTREVRELSIGQDGTAAGQEGTSSMPPGTREVRELSIEQDGIAARQEVAHTVVQIHPGQERVFTEGQRVKVYEPAIPGTDERRYLGTGVCIKNSQNGTVEVKLDSRDFVWTHFVRYVYLEPRS